jgi:hypothetical protein
MTNTYLTALQIATWLYLEAKKRPLSLEGRIKPTSLNHVSERLAATEIPVGADTEVIFLRLCRIEHNQPQHFFPDEFHD